MRNSKEEIQFYIQRLYDKNLTTMSGGNLSIKEDNSTFVTPSEVDKGNLTPEDIMEVTNSGETIGKHRVTSEFLVHKAIYENNKKMRAVLHSHTSSILGFSTAHILPKVDILADVAKTLHNKIGMAKYADPGTKDLADVTVAVLDGKNNLVAIEENHGLFIGHKDMETCYDILEDIDLVCKIENNAKKLNSDVVEINENDIDGYANFEATIENSDETCANNYEQERKLVHELLQRLYKRGISTCKNACFSYRLDNGDILINPENVDVYELKPEDLVVIRNKKYIGSRKPHRDFYLHLAVYENDKKNNSIITSRPPYVMAYGCSDKEYVTRVVAECYGYLRNIDKKDFCYGDKACEAVKNHFDNYHNTLILKNYLTMVVAEYPLKTYDRMEVAESTAQAIIETYLTAKPVLMDQRSVEVIQKNCKIYPEPIE